MMRRLLSTLAAAALAAALVPAAAFAAQYTIVPTLPLQGDHVETGRPTIAFQIHGSDSTNAIPQGAVHLLIDGVDVSGQLAAEGVNLAYVPQQALVLGQHEIHVDVDDGSGGEIGYTWTFFVDADDEQPPPDQAQQYENNPYGTLTPASDDYAYGDDAGFYFNGAPGGFGYLSFGGFPGIYPLIPVFGFPGLFYASFPVPYGYHGGPIVANFTNPNGGSGTFAPAHPVTFAPVGGPSNRRYVTGTARVVPSYGRGSASAPVPASPYAATMRFMPPIGARGATPGAQDARAIVPSETGPASFSATNGGRLMLADPISAGASLARPNGMHPVSASGSGAYVQVRASLAAATARSSAPAPSHASAPSNAGGGHTH